MAATKFKIESGVQLLARLTKKVEIKDFYTNLFQGGLMHGDAVEIFSDVSTSNLLVDIISDALIPNKINGEPIGVLMFNTAGKFIYEELMKTLQTKISLRMETCIDDEIRQSNLDRMLHKTLSNFFILEIYDAMQFYTTIHNLENVLIKHSNISLILFDTLTAFYWSEQGFKITKMDIYLRNLLRMIQNVSKEYKVILIYTRPGYFSSSKDTDNLKTSQVMEGISYKVHLIDNGAEDYQVNVKTSDTYYMKSYKIVDNIIKWQ